MIKNILFVCTGNICRSPMAEYILRTRVDDKKINVSSAGTHALVAYPADSAVLHVMQSKGLDLSLHRARQINESLIDNSDLILTMSSEQKKYLEKYYLNACGKVFRIGEWSEFDVMDPYKRPKVVFEQVYALLMQGIDDWYRKLWKDNV